jgi:hypothetical protein
MNDWQHSDQIKLQLQLINLVRTDNSVFQPTNSKPEIVVCDTFDGYRKSVKYMMLYHT